MRKPEIAVPGFQGKDQDNTSVILSHLCFYMQGCAFPMLQKKPRLLTRNLAKYLNISENVSCQEIALAGKRERFIAREMRKPELEVRVSYDAILARRVTCQYSSFPAFNARVSFHD